MIAQPDISWALPPASVQALSRLIGHPCAVLARDVEITLHGADAPCLVIGRLGMAPQRDGAACIAFATTWTTSPHGFDWHEMTITDADMPGDFHRSATDLAEDVVSLELAPAGTPISGIAIAALAGCNHSTEPEQDETFVLDFAVELTFADGAQWHLITDTPAIRGAFELRRGMFSAPDHGWPDATVTRRTLN